MSILRESSRTLLLALSIVGVVACGGEDTPPGNTDGPNEPEPVEPEPCLLRFDTEPLRWSAVGVGYTASQLIEFSNEGDESCRVTLSVEGDGFAIEETATLTVEADATRSVAVAWTPTAVGTASGSLLVTSGDLDEEIALEGEAVAGCLTLAPEVVSFGDATPGCSTREAEVVIENGCSHPVLLDSLTTGGGDAPGSVFGIRLYPPYGSNLPVGGSAPMRLAFRPLEAGAQSDVLTVTEANGAAVTAELQGSGVHDAVQLDEYENGVRPRVDVLLVVDDSAAMTPHLERAQAYVESMIDIVRRNPSLVRVGATTTSRSATPGCNGSGADGRLVPFDGSGPRWIDGDDDLPSSAFGDLLDVGGCSTAPNEGLAAAVRALTEPLVSQVDDPAHGEADDGNAGFRREGYALSVVFISASDDNSGETVAAWHERFRQIVGEGNEDQLRIHALVAPAGGCDAATAGTRYSALANLTGGSVYSVCGDASWSWGIADWPKIWDGRYHLSGRPADADGNGNLIEHFVVSVDDVEVGPTADDGSTRWTYDAADNVIAFEPDHLPAEGTRVRITYRTVCG